MKNRIYLYTIGVFIMFFILIYFLCNLNSIEPIIYKVLNVNVGNPAKYNVAYLTKQFLFVAGISTGISLVLGVTIGIFCSSDFGKEFNEIIEAISTILKSFPEIAMIRFIVPLLGLGAWPSIIALVTHGVLPVIFSTTSGIENVDKNLIKAAKGIGLSNYQIFTKIVLPLSIPVIISGFRVTVISCIGGATIASSAGAEGLGILLKAGQETYNIVLIFECALVILLLSLISDFTLKIAEHKIGSYLHGGA